jgi:hypothetical protein
MIQSRTGLKSNMEVTGRPVWLVVQNRPWPAPVQRMVRSIKRGTERSDLIQWVDHGCGAAQEKCKIQNHYNLKQI